jgi:L-fuconolactonase
MASFPRIDAHQHFWDPERAEYPFLTDELKAIRRKFGPADLLPELMREGFDGTVLVQTRSSMDETREFLETAAATPFVLGVVGWVDLTAPDVADAIADLRAGTGGKRLVGIRHQVHDEPDPEWLLRDDVARGLAAVEASGLAYDLLVRTRELPAAAAVAKAFPELRFVLDHLGKPPLASRDLRAWSKAIRPLGKLPNVTAKVSGLVTEANWDDWSIEDLRDAIDIGLRSFGPRRLMIGSDWPVCLLAGSYEKVLGVSRELLGRQHFLARRTREDRDDMLGGTAMRTYRLELRPD